LVLPKNYSTFDEFALTELRFNGNRLKVLAAAEDNGILCTPADGELTVVSPHAKIAGIEPTILGEDAVGEILTLVVALHHLRSPYHDDTLLTGLHLVSLFIDDTHLGSFQRGDGSLHSMGERPYCNNRGAFSQTIPVEQLDADRSKEEVHPLAE